MELTNPGVCPLTGDVGRNATAEISKATDKVRGTNFLIITFLSKT
jgi:hypothetical protein